MNAGGVGYKVAQIIVHNQFNQNTYHNNIALLKTTSNIVYTNYVKPVGLASYDTPIGAVSTLAGWGYLSVSIKLEIGNKFSRPDRFWSSLLNL